MQTRSPRRSVEPDDAPLLRSGHRGAALRSPMPPNWRPSSPRSATRCRLRLLSLVAAQGEVCSCHLEEPLGKSQPTISHHTKVLAEAGLIVGERRGKWMWWTVVPERLALIRAPARRRLRRRRDDDNDRSGEPRREQTRRRYAEAARDASEGRAACDCGTENCVHVEGRGVGPRRSTRRPSSREMPETAVLASLGCGNPTAVADFREGETVLDLGSGGGLDVILSARRVGESGTVYGLDMTDEMLALAEANAAEAGRPKRPVPEGRDRGDPASLGERRRRHLQLRHQPLARQGCGVRRDGPCPPAGRSHRDQRHRRRGRSRPAEQRAEAAARARLHRRRAHEERVHRRARDRRASMASASSSPTRRPRACTAPS